MKEEGPIIVRLELNQPRGEGTERLEEMREKNFEELNKVEEIDEVVVKLMLLNWSFLGFLEEESGKIESENDDIAMEGRWWWE